MVSTLSRFTLRILPRRQSMSDLKKRHEENWARMPGDLRLRAVRHLRLELHPDTQQELRNLIAEDPEEWWVEHHMFAGTAIRNLLREVIKDEELPPVRYDQGEMRNWDDYYVPAVEAAFSAT